MRLHLGAQLLRDTRRILQEEVEALEAHRREVATLGGGRRAEREECQRNLVRIEQRFAALRLSGALQEAEELEPALARWAARVQALAQEEETAEQRGTAAQAGLLTATEERKEQEALGAQAQHERGQLVQELEVVETRLQALRADPTLHLVLEDVAPDLLLLGAAAQERTAAASLRAGGQLLALRVEDELAARALEALEQRGLLPPSLDTERVLDVLLRGGVSAFSGGAYLAENAVGARADALIRARPELCAGVVVAAEDLAAARTLLAAATTCVQSPVAVGSTAALLGGVSAQLVVLPQRALYDRDAAEDERAQQREGAAQRHARIAQLAVHKQRLDALHQALLAFLRDHGGDYYSRQRSRIARLVEQREHHQAQAQAARQRAQAAQDALDALAQESRRRASALREATRAQAALHELLAQGGDRTSALRQKRDRLLEESAALERKEEELLLSVRRVSGRLGDLERSRAQQERERHELSQDRKAAARDLPGGDGEGGLPYELPELPEESTAPTLDAARDQHRACRALYEERTGGVALRGEIDAAERQQGEQEKTLACALEDERDPRGAGAELTREDAAAALREAEDTLGLAAMPLG